MANVVKHKQRRKRIARALERRMADARMWSNKVNSLPMQGEEYQIATDKLYIAMRDVEGCKTRLGN